MEGEKRPAGITHQQRWVAAASAFTVSTLGFWGMRSLVSLRTTDSSVSFGHFALLRKSRSYAGTPNLSAICWTVSPSPSLGVRYSMCGE